MQLIRESQDSFLTAATAESSLVFLLNSLLIPIIPVATLLLCLWAGNQSLRGSYFFIAVLSFLLASDFLGVVQSDATRKEVNLALACFDIPIRWALLVAFLAVVIYLSSKSDTVDYELLLIWAAVTLPALLLGRWSALGLIRARLKRRSSRHAVIVGATELGLRLEESLREDRVLRTHVMGYFDDRQPERLALSDPGKVLGKTSSLAEYVVRNPVNLVYITLPMSRDQRILSIIDALRDSTASIYFVPDLLAFDSIQAGFDVVNGIPVVAVCETPFYGLSRLVKRLSDICIATLALVCTAPLLLGTAIGVRLSSPGPVLFKQRRYGLNGREILVYKFRSMTVTEDGKSSFTAAVRGDSRITPFGSFIRKTSLDELPQLFNVLEGSMSIIGPRPHPVAMNEQYRRLIPSYMVRHKVKPGITGWAQVNGYRGGDDLESMRKRIEFDLAYLRNWSLWLDLKILLMTVAVVWTDRNAY